MEIAIGIASTAIAIIAACIAAYQARIAQKAVLHAAEMKLFISFDLANQAVLANPELLYSVHGVDRTIPKEEAHSIAYLSLLLDGFEQFYGHKYRGAFVAMQSEMARRTTFLSRILAVPDNQRRWNLLKEIFYGQFDKSFVSAIDNLIRVEQRRQS